MSPPAHPYRIANEDAIDSPALLVYEEPMEENLRRMVSEAGGPERLRPHIKTHKLPQVLRRHLAHGITRFKAATIAEAELCALEGAPDVLLAYPPVGPRAERLAALVQAYPGTRFSTVLDDPGVARWLSSVMASRGREIEVLLDIDCGQHRTGIPVGDPALALYRLVGNLPCLRAGGLHVYDGHIHDRDPVERARRCDEAFAPVEAFRGRLISEGLAVPRVVAGGTPTFPIHARRDGVECSPGTCVFWDQGYSVAFPDMHYRPAVALLTRVVSRPLPNRLCLDLGHKSVASEMPHPRVHLLELPDAVFVGHNEEHLLVETPRADEFPVGAALYAIPWHVCPTVALHGEVQWVRGGTAVERWRVTGRDRRLKN
jgi:D-serine deaminase-like pyridoxal phosphate-dependent protein